MKRAIDRIRPVDPDFLKFFDRKISITIFLQKISILAKNAPKMPYNNRAFRINPDTELGQIFSMLLSKYHKTSYCRIDIADEHHIIKISKIYDSNEGNIEKSHICIYCNSDDNCCLYCNGIDPNSINTNLCILPDVFIRKIPSSEFIERKDIYSYYSKRCQNLYFEYNSILQLIKYIFDSPEKKYSRRRIFLLLYERLPEHNVFGNLDLIRNIVSFI